MANYSITTHMTRKLMAESLKKLMETKPLTKISVREIVEDSHLNRQTFYYHFQDVYALLEWIIKEEAISLVDKHDDWTTWQDGVIAVLLYIKRNEKVCLNAYQTVSRELLRQFLYSDIIELFHSGIDQHYENTHVTRAQKNFVAHFYTIAFAGVIEHWLLAGMKETPESLVQSFTAMVEGGIPGILNQFEFDNLNKIKTPS